jgi:hypothetical protein
MTEQLVGRCIDPSEYFHGIDELDFLSKRLTLSCLRFLRLESDCWALQGVNDLAGAGEVS